jgi:hypothetical protein
VDHPAKVRFDDLNLFEMASDGFGVKMPQNEPFGHQPSTSEFGWRFVAENCDI